MTLVTLSDGRTVDLDSIENCVPSSLANENRRTEVSHIADFENSSDFRAIQERIHVYDFYHIPGDEDMPPPYNSQSILDRPSYNMALRVDLISEEELPSCDMGISSDPLMEKNKTLVIGDSMLGNTHPHNPRSHQTQVQNKVLLPEIEGVLQPTERAMTWTVQAMPDRASSSSQMMPLKEGKPSSFQSLNIEQYVPNLKRKYLDQPRSTFIECWLAHKKCSGDLPCTRCSSKRRSIATYAQPCIYAPLDALSPNLIDLQINKLTLECVTIQAKNKRIDQILIPLNEALQRPGPHWIHVCEALNQPRPETYRLDCAIDQLIRTLFYNLRNLNMVMFALIKKYCKDTSEISPDLIIFSFTFHQKRAEVCQRLLHSLQSEMRKNFRFKCQNIRNMLLFLILVFREVRQFASFEVEDMLLHGSNELLSVLLRPTRARETVVDHLLRWLLYYITRIAEKTGLDPKQRLRRTFTEIHSFRDMRFTFITPNSGGGLENPTVSFIAGWDSLTVSVTDGTSCVLTISDFVEIEKMDLSLSCLPQEIFADVWSHRAHMVSSGSSKKEKVGILLERLILLMTACRTILEISACVIDFYARERK